MKSVWKVGVPGATLLLVPLLIVHAQTTTPEVLPVEPVIEATTPTTPTLEESVIEGQVLGATTTEVGTTTESLILETNAASSTEPISQPEPVREQRTVFLQPSVKMDSHLKTGPVTVTITVQNLTCRYCDTASPPVAIKAFYTEWLDNDGTDRVNATSTVHLAEQAFTIPTTDPWGFNSVEWQANTENAGHYSFVVLVDPDNTIGAKDAYRTEFFVD